MFELSEISLGRIVYLNPDLVRLIEWILGIYENNTIKLEIPDD